jgi:hypothetical protein
MTRVRDRRENAVGGDEDREALQRGQTRARRAVTASARVRRRTTRATVGGAAKEWVMRGSTLKIQSSSFCVPFSTLGSVRLA